MHNKHNDESQTMSSRLSVRHSRASQSAESYERDDSTSATVEYVDNATFIEVVLLFLCSGLLLFVSWVVRGFLDFGQQEDVVQAM